MTQAEINKLYIQGEAAKISDKGLERFLLAAIDKFPDYFWTAPASVSKHHYSDERESGGLVLHTRRLCKLADDVARMQALNFWEKDVLISACILHDSFARGLPNDVKTHSDPLHPVYPELMFPYNAFADRYIKDRRVYDEIMLCVISHLGRFSFSETIKSSKKLPLLFQLIDYLGSRPYIKIEL